MKKLLIMSTLLLTIPSLIYAMDQQTPSADESNSLKTSGMFTRAEQESEKPFDYLAGETPVQSRFLGDDTTSEKPTPSYSPWTDLAKTTEKIQGLQERVTRMKEMDISPEDLVQLKQDVQALSLSQELQKAHKIAGYYHLLLHTMDTATSHLTETGLYTPEQLQAFGSSINPVSTTTCQFLDQFHAAQHNIMSLQNDLFPQQSQRPVNIAMTSLFAAHLMSLPQVWKKIEEERTHQAQGGEPRPIVISDEDFQPDASSDELSDSKGSESDDKQEDKQ